MYDTDWSKPLQALTYREIEDRLKAVLELCDPSSLRRPFSSSSTEEALAEVRAAAMGWK